MKERPILFSAPMVRALLDGTKTQTRRISKEFNEPDAVRMGFDNDCAKQFDPRFENGIWKAAEKGYEYPCPYGRPGDRLWVRETFNTYRTRTAEEEAEMSEKMAAFQRGEVTDILAAAKALPGSSGPLAAIYKADYGEWANNPDSDLGPWKPSIFMPRWASRLTLEITAIRVERLQDISTADAIAEGLEFRDDLASGRNYKFYGKDFERLDQWTPTARWSYESLWNSINGPGSWAKNPWVWVLELNKLPPQNP